MPRNLIIIISRGGRREQVSFCNLQGRSWRIGTFFR